MKRKENFLLRTVGGVNLLVPLAEQVKDTNGIVIMNETGSYVWFLLAEDRSIDDLSEEMAKRFGVTLALARADVEAFLDEIGQIGLIEK